MNDKFVMALGFFDGAHIGHRELFRRTLETAERLGAVPSALTFETHPDALALGVIPPLINTAEERKRLIEALGPDVKSMPFDEKIMKTPWDAFVRDLARQGAVGLVVGQDFRFGWKGEGDAERLRAECARLNIRCDIIPEVLLDGVVVSSTYIRRLIGDGEMEKAAKFLGRNHSIGGVVAHGKRLGTEIGVPTVNIALPEGLVKPKFGVYATKIGAYRSVTNVGVRPTIDDGDGITVETTLLGFKGNMYDEKVRVEFLRFIRPERKFENVEALRTQIQEDIRECVS
ncbi:riboflavin biosynthesis protein [Clostridia bacterium]|nr:riboflavin biosynthesis protein [Clostridia bacterium]